MSNEKKVTLVALTADQLDALLTLLEPSSDEGDSGEELWNHLSNVKSIPIASQMYFINEYRVDQQYGGPEEGGWYYHTQDCIASRGFSVEGKDFRFIATELQQILIAGYLPDMSEKALLPETSDICNALTEHDCYTAYQTDKYGEGFIVAIERAPGESHDTKRQIYC